MNKKVGITSGQPLILFLYFLKQGNIVYLSFLIILISKVNISPMLHSNMNSTEKWHLLLSVLPLLLGNFLKDKG